MLRKIRFMGMLWGVVLLVQTTPASAQQALTGEPICPERRILSESSLIFLEANFEDETIFYLVPPLTIGTVESIEWDNYDLRLTFPLADKWTKTNLDNLAREIRMERDEWIERINFSSLPRVGVSGYLKTNKPKDRWKGDLNPDHLKYLSVSIVQDDDAWRLVIRIPNSAKNEFVDADRSDFSFFFWVYPIGEVSGISVSCWPIQITHPLGALPKEAFPIDSPFSSD